MQQRVLAVYPHPDDETFGKAGTIAMFTRQGVPVTLICATLGQMGRNMGNPFFANRETLYKVREQELREACRILGIEDLRLLGLRDKTLEFEDPERLADLVFAVLQEVKPTIVMTYYPEHGVHPDHDALSHATILAVKRLPKDQRPIVYGSPVTNNARQVLGPPDVVNDVTALWDIKLAAIRAHRSQSEAMLKNMEKRMTEDPEYKDQMDRFLRTESFWIYKIPDHD